MRRAALALVASLALAGSARAEDEQARQVKIVLDDGARVQDRETALGNAYALALRTSPPHPGALSDAMRPLLERLKQRTKEKAYEHFIIAALKALDAFVPFADLGPVVRPYLGPDVPRPIRREALNAVVYNGASGIGAELEAILKEPEADDGGRAQLERNVMDAALATPPGEGARVLAFVLESSRFPASQRGAAMGLGEKRSAEGKNALVKALSAANRDDVLCAVVTALVRYGSLDGVNELLKKTKKRPSREVYKTLCDLAYKPDGFKGVSPEHFYEVDGKERAAAVAALQEWWKASAAKAPDQLLYDAIRAGGVSVPSDPSSKEMVTALIEALALDPPALRYSALEILVKKTDQKELAKDFNVLKTAPNATTSVYETEPHEGFEDLARRARLKEQQKVKIDKWREWWRSAQSRATLVDGVWRTS